MRNKKLHSSDHMTFKNILTRYSIMRRTVPDKLAEKCADNMPDEMVENIPDRVAKNKDTKQSTHEAQIV